MRSAADVVGVDDKLVRAIMAETDLTAEEVKTAASWVDEAMTRSRFNRYYEFDKTVRHLRLAILVAPDDLEFSLEAHGFQPLPDSHPDERVIAAITAIMANTAALQEYIKSLPML